jgi:hypothetical protein
MDDFEGSPSSRQPIRDLGLTIPGTALEPILEEFVGELRAAGIAKLTPHFYLSMEWGVPLGSISIAIPFYLARPELAALQRARAGMVEGASRADILRYLRHEMGHVVNYAYRLYDDADWVKAFGSMTQPDVEDYRPVPFSTQFVRHLPGGYAQKHPDEDWSETFAVWMTPGARWREDYADWPDALAKLEFVDRTIRAIGDTPPLIDQTDLDEDVDRIEQSLFDVYGALGESNESFPPGLDGALRAIFDDLPRGSAHAADLLIELVPDLATNVYRWTGHFPEKTRALVGHLARRAADLGLGYDAAAKNDAIIAITTLVTAMAMSHVQHGSYSPA